MSRHWNPDSEIRRWSAEADMPPSQRKAPWPEGATAGLLLVVTCCVAAGLVIYQVAGPRNLVERGVGPSEPGKR